MLRLSVGALRTRWQLFAGAVVAVALGVGLVQSGLQMLAATDVPVLPAGLSAYERAKVREGYVGAATLLGMSVMLAVFLSVFIVSTTFGFMTVQRRREFGLLRLVGAQRGYLCLMVVTEAGLLGVVGSVVGLPLGVLATWAQSWLLVRLCVVTSPIRDRATGSGGPAPAIACPQPPSPVPTPHRRPAGHLPSARRRPGW